MRVKYWESISDIILDNWMKCTDGDLRFVRINPDLETEETEEDQKEWYRIYDQYIIKYKLSAMYLKLLKTLQKKALLELEFVKTREQFKLTQLSIEEEKLRMMLNNKGNSMTIEECLIHLSRWLGGSLLNKKTLTAEQYFDLINEYGKFNKTK